MFYIMAKPQTLMMMKFMSNSAKHDKIMKMKPHTPLRFTLLDLVVVTSEGVYGTSEDMLRLSSLL